MDNIIDNIQIKPDYSYVDVHSKLIDLDASKETKSSPTDKAIYIPNAIAQSSTK
jgi:hypothetical protein